MRSKMNVVIALVLSMLMIVSGCGKRGEMELVERSNKLLSSEKANVNNEGAENRVMQDVAMDMDGKASSNLKVIVNGYVAIECVDFEKTVENIKNYISKSKGYIASSDIQGISKNQENDDVVTRNAIISVRIPKGGHDTFVSGLKNFGQITQEKTTSEDITEKYFDTDARISSLKVQESRLLELFRRADKIADIIVIEDKLMQVRGEIESMTSTVKRWDNQVAYSTLELSIKEVKRYEAIKTVKDGFFTKIILNFKQSILNLKDTLQWVILVLVYFVPYFVLIGILIYLFKFIINKRKRLKNKELENEKEKDE